MPEVGLLEWLRRASEEYSLDLLAIYRRGILPKWPLVARSPEELDSELEARGHFLPLPKEPAALANLIEVAVVDFLLDRIDREPSLIARRGTERGYPDVEVETGGEAYAVDVKVARRARGGRRTQSKITLYTGNTYFRWPELIWPGTFRAFNDYRCHIDLIVLYDFTEARPSRVENLEIVVQEPWRIGSRQRSSTTREYIGAVQSIDALREGRGEFGSEAEFYDFWRRFNFKIGRAVEQQLARLLAVRSQK